MPPALRSGIIVNISTFQILTILERSPPHYHLSFTECLLSPFKKSTGPCGALIRFSSITILSSRLKIIFHPTICQSQSQWQEADITIYIDIAANNNTLKGSYLRFAPQTFFALPSLASESFLKWKSENIIELQLTCLSLLQQVSSVLMNSNKFLFKQKYHSQADGE